MLTGRARRQPGPTSKAHAVNSRANSIVILGFKKAPIHIERRVALLTFFLLRPKCASTEATILEGKATEQLLKLGSGILKALFPTHLCLNRWQ